MEYKKICSDCGFNVDFEAKFCPNCGSNRFRALEETEETTLLTPEDSPFNRNNQQNFAAQQGDFQTMPGGAQQYNMPVNSAPAKKKSAKPALIGVIVVIVLIVLGVTGTIVEKAAQARDSGISDPVDTDFFDETDDLNEQGVAFTTGRIEDGYYINEWANIKFKTTEDIYDIPEAHSNYESEREQCGFAAVNEKSGEQFIISFEDLSDYSFMDDKKYLSAMKTTLNSSFDESGFTAGESQDGSVTIAGKNYLTYEQTMFNVNDVELKIKVCVRIQGDKAIVFMLMSQSDEFMNDIIDSIEYAE